MNAISAHQELADCLLRLQLGLGASELHGSLAGYLCAGGLAKADNWLAELALDEVAERVAESEEAPLFRRLFESVTADLADPGLVFTPLLPSDDAPMSERTTALVDWCRGFLGGVGLSGAAAQGSLTGDLGEVLGDFDRIAGSDFGAGDSAEDDEEALAEVVEYVRIGALLVRTELAGVASAATRH